MKISWLRLLAAGALYVALANCSNSDSSGSGNNTNNTCNAYTSSESSACTSCVSSSCQTQITAAQPACNAFVACVCAANGSVSACQTQLNENGCSALANSVQSCAQSNCSTSCTGTSSGGSSGSSSGSSNGCPTGQPAPACASNADCTGGMQCNTTSCSCSCPANTTQCGSACADTATDNSNCGACGNACNNGETCQGGHCLCSDGKELGTSPDCHACSTACFSGEVCAPPSTPNTPSNCSCPDGLPLNGDTDCGTCGNSCAAVGEKCGPGGSCTCGSGACPSSQTCTAGKPGNPSACCSATAPLNCGQGRCGACCADSDCPTTGDQCCNNTCVQTHGTDRSNCGACFQVCDTVCTAGSCTKPVCGTNQTACGASNCCDNATQTCQGNSCVPFGCAAGCGAGACCNNNCTNETSDPANCGGCGITCGPGVPCTAGHCTTALPPQSCLAGSALTILITGSNVTAYVPNGWWEDGTTGVVAVAVEGASPPAPVTIPTAQVVNSCSSDSSLGTVVCIANNVGAPGNDVYIISGATNAITNTLTSGGGLPPGTESFTGGTCNTCAQGINSVNHTGFLSIGTSTGADFQPFDLTTGTLGTPIASGQLSTAENIVVDPVRNLVLSPNENYGGGTNDYQLLNISTGSVYDFSPTTTPPILGINGDFDSAGEDCTTGIALSTVEFTGQLFITDLTQATFTGTSWSAPYSANDFPEFDALSAGTSGIAIAPNSHLGVVAGEFGGNLFGAIQLPATSGGGTPTLVDWVQAAIPTDPGGFDFANGFDPHTVTAYTSPTSGLNYAVFADYATESPSYLAIVDLQALLALPRSAPGAHTLATPLTNPTPVVTFIKL